MLKRRCSPSTFDFLGLTHFSAIADFHENKLVLRAQSRYRRSIRRQKNVTKADPSCPQ
jgi:hypothetical protein